MVKSFLREPAKPRPSCRSPRPSRGCRCRRGRRGRPTTPSSALPAARDRQGLHQAPAAWQAAPPYPGLGAGASSARAAVVDSASAMPMVVASRLHVDARLRRKDSTGARRDAEPQRRAAAAARVAAAERRRVAPIIRAGTATTTTPTTTATATTAATATATATAAATTAAAAAAARLPGRRRTAPRAASSRCSWSSKYSAVVAGLMPLASVPTADQRTWTRHARRPGTRRPATTPLSSPAYSSCGVRGRSSRSTSPS